MFVYWVLLAFPAIFALAYPVQNSREQFGGAQSIILSSFMAIYVLIGTFRVQVGADWTNYEYMFLDIGSGDFAFALERIDPAYGGLNWVSAKLGAGIYLVNGVCCLLLAYGTVLVAKRFREPWMAIVIAVPYLLIVVGFGYVRQAAAIGLILIAIDSHVRGLRAWTIASLVIATAFHATALLAVPAFAWTLVRRSAFTGVIAALLFALIYYYVLAPRLGQAQVRYSTGGFDSTGTLVRVMMGFVPSTLILLRWRAFETNARARSLWLLFAWANVAALVAFGLVPTSTVVDRAALYFAVIQLAAFGEFRSLLGIPDQMTVLARMAMIGVAVAVQGVWLVYATHSVYWVPYRSVLDLWM